MKEKTSLQTDIFSLAATLYRLLTGTLPVDAYTRALAVWSNKPDPLQLPSNQNQNIPAELDDIIMKSMSIFPSLRPKSVSVLKQAIYKQERQAASTPRKPEEALKSANMNKVSSGSAIKTPYFDAYLKQLEYVKEKYLLIEKEVFELTDNSKINKKFTEEFMNIPPKTIINSLTR